MLNVIYLKHVVAVNFKIHVLLTDISFNGRVIGYMDGLKHYPNGSLTADNVSSWDLYVRNEKKM